MFYIYKWQKPQKSQYIDDDVVINKRIGEYWNHYVLMYIDSRNQVQMQGLGINKIKDTLINLVIKDPEITYDFISFILSNAPKESIA